MWKKTLLRLLVFLLVMAFIFSSIAVPASRSLKAMTENIKDQDSHYQAVLESTTSGLLEEEGESFIEGRMDFERTDYSGSGANNDHDPKPPGSF